MRSNTETAFLARADDDVITAHEASRLVGKNVRGVYRAVEIGLIPPGAYWRIGRDLRFSRSKLLEWRNSGGNAPLSTQAAA